MMPPSGKPLVGKSMPRRLAPLRIGSGTGGLASLRVRRHGVARAMPTRLRCFGLRAGRSAPIADELIAWPDWAPAYLRHLPLEVVCTTLERLAAAAVPRSVMNSRLFHSITSSARASSNGGISTAREEDCDVEAN